MEKKGNESSKNEILNTDSKGAGIISNTTNKISEFFHHMIAYGGFDLRDGIITYWGDYSVFLPIESFVTLFYELEKELGEKEAHELFYWMGKLIGSNSTNLLLKRYGLDKKDLPIFVNGATQDGFGYLKIQEYDKDFNYGLVTGINSTFALEYKRKYGKTNTPIDFYLSGMLAGGTEPLLGKYYQVTETECMARGDNKCLYKLESIKNKPKFNLFNNSVLNEEEIIKKTLHLILTRKSSFKPFGKKEIVFGDGSFKLRGITGINFMNYGKIVLDEILKLKLKNKKINFDKILIERSVEGIKNKILKKNINEILKEIEILGYGKFNIKISGTIKILISNENNPYPQDYVELFGRNKGPVDIFIVLLLEKIYEINGKKVKVNELKCRAKGDNECLFEINFI